MFKHAKRRRKLFATILIDVAIIAAIIIYFGFIRHSSQPKISGVYINTPRELAEFHLIDNHAEPFTKANIKGRWTIMFFGFTHCPMICPTTMGAINTMYTILQKDLPASELPLVVFITVDPGRDTVAKLNRFVTAFNPHFIGVRGNMDETIALEKQLHVTVSTAQKKSNENDIAIDHSMDILVLNPEGNVQAYFLYPQRPELMAKDYKTLVWSNMGVAP